MMCQKSANTECHDAEYTRNLRNLNSIIEASGTGGARGERNTKKKSREYHEIPHYPRNRPHREGPRLRYVGRAVGRLEDQKGLRQTTPHKAHVFLSQEGTKTIQGFWHVTRYCHPRVGKLETGCTHATAIVSVWRGKKQRVPRYNNIFLESGREETKKTKRVLLLLVVLSY